MRNNLIILFLGSIAILNTVKAKDVYDVPEVTPIINQLYPSVSELSFNLAYFPVGAFNKHLGLGASYLSLLSPNQGWEILSGYYFMEVPTGLKNAVMEPPYNVPADSFPVLKYLLKTGYSYIPFYSKSIVFNTYQVHSRTLLNLSVGISDYLIEKPAFVSVGYGQNFYFGKNKGIKFEVNYLSFFKKSDYIQNQITISLGMLLAWGENE